MKQLKVISGILVTLFALLLVGCTKIVEIPVPVQVNHTIYSISVIQNRTIEYINISTPADCNCNTTNTTPKHFLSLIGQLKRCEDNIVRHWNLTECVWEIEKLNRSLASCNESLEEIRELLD